MLPIDKEEELEETEDKEETPVEDIPLPVE